TIVKDPAHVETEEQLWDKFVLPIPGRFSGLKRRLILSIDIIEALT
ncbi:hypothetical protein O5833_28050, partial [Escherichia coli]|nr:hypothetical protein [Escherichia coli]